MLCKDRTFVENRESIYVCTYRQTERESYFTTRTRCNGLLSQEIDNTRRERHALHEEPEREREKEKAKKEKIKTIA